MGRRTLANEVTGWFMRNRKDRKEKERKELESGRVVNGKRI